MKRQRIKVNVHEYEVIHATKGGDKRIETDELLYGLAYSKLVSSQKTYTIVDEKFHLDKLGEHDVVLFNPTEKQREKLRQFDEWKGRVKGTLVFLVDSTDAKEEFKKLREKGECWKALIHRFVDDTKEGKSPELTDVVKAHIVPIPRSLVDYQQFNNNAIELGPSKSGKTVSYLRIGCLPKQDPTVAGMLGSVQQDNITTILGTLHGSGLIVYDEFPEWGSPVVNHLLNYLEIGETTRDLVTPVQCRGNKTLVFLGNYDKFGGNEFLKNIQGLATGKALDRIGSRFAHIIFQELNPVLPQFSNRDFVVFMRELVRSALNQYEKKIVWIMKGAVKWFAERDGDYESKLDDLICYVKSERIKTFLKGCKLHTPRLKMSALKKAIAEHLDLIVLGYSRVLKKHIFEEAKNNYELFKLYNLKSFDNFLCNEKKRFRGLVGLGSTKEQIISELNMSQATFYRWKKELSFGDAPEKMRNSTF